MTAKAAGAVAEGGEFRLGWRPGIVTLVCLTVSIIFGVWQMSPIFWSEIGNDSRVFYAAARVANSGGDPYDFGRVSAEAQRVNDEQQAAGTGRSGLGANTYAYPPVMTRAWQLAAPLGDAGFLVVNALVALIAGVVGFELVLIALRWEGRWLPRLFFLFSLPLLTAVGSGNPAPLLLLGWGGALLAALRDRPVVAGALLAVGWIKPPVGIAMALALMIATLPSWRRTLAGLAAGSVVFALANLAAGGADRMAAWVRSLFAFTASIDVNQVVVLQQRFLAGLSAPFEFAGPFAASIIAVAIVATVVFWALSGADVPGLFAQRKPLLLGLLVAAALAGSPYLHTYDLVLEAVPVLVIASLPLTGTSRLTLVLWGLASVLNLATVLTVVVVTHQRDTTWSFAVALTGLTLVAIAAAARRGGQDMAEPAAG